MTDKLYRNNQRGFTMVEVLIALALGGLVMAAVMTAFRGQHATYLHQEQTAEMQQNLRVAMDMLSREIRSSGYDPTGGSGAGIVAATENRLIFTRDLDASGGIYISSDHPVENDASERIGYRLNDNPPALGRVTGNGVVPQPVADNIVALEFLYLLDDGTMTLNPDPADFNDIRGVVISLLARAANQDTGYTHTDEYITASEEVWGPYDDGYRRRMQTQTIKLRNMGLE